MKLRALGILPLSVSLLGLTIAAHARAETVSIDTTTIARVFPDQSAATLRTVEGSFQGVGFSDCSGDTSFIFNVAIADFTSTTSTTYNLQAWAGEGDCSTTVTNCWPVTDTIVPSTPFAVHVRVEDLLSNIGASPPPQTYSVATSNACATAKNSLQSTSSTSTDDAGNSVVTAGEATINVFFLLLPIGSTIPSAASPAYPIKVKLTGPGAVTNLVAAPGNTELVVSWTPPADLDVAGFDIYTAPSGAGDAGICATIDTSTAAHIMVTGGATATIQSLINGSAYAVAVDAYDQFGNTGPISSTTCGSPAPVDDFWTVYNQQGGKAGGCALATGAGGAGGGLMLGVALMIWIRRRKTTR